MAQQNILDVAIIGGGVSGVYSGLRLLTSERTGHSPFPADKHLEVAIFEQSNRIGGRLISVAPPGISTKVEIGGMRYTSEHKRVISLVEKFNLKPVPFPVQEDQNFAYLRGKHLRISELKDAKNLPYTLKPDEATTENLTLGFTGVAAKRLLKEMTGEDKDLAHVDWQEIVEKYEFDGMSITDLPLRYLMQRMIGHEAYEFAVDSSGYDSILYTWSGADGFPWNLGDFGAKITYSRLEEGYQMIPLLLHREFTEHGGHTYMEHSLIGFDTIQLEDGTAGVELRIEHNNEIQTHQARNLILAMPRRALEMLEATGQVMNPANTQVRDLIESVTPIPLFKLALCYNTPWWENLPDAGGNFKQISGGESITDLPVRQVYYWYVDEKTGCAVVLIYDDGLALTYWAGLRDHGDKFENQADSSGPEDGLPDWNDYPAPARMVNEAHRQIVEMHDADPAKVKSPYAAAYMDWGMDPYGGGANFWHVGVKSHQVSKDIVQPMKDTPVFICGESYSHQQGWVEGALNTAEDMLHNHLHLCVPETELNE